jgi:hypothetical protein
MRANSVSAGVCPPKLAPIENGNVLRIPASNSPQPAPEAVPFE